MIEAGKLAGTNLLLMPKEVLTESVPGSFYHVRVKTETIRDEYEAARVLSKGLYEKFGAEVVWIRVANGVIDMQLKGSPFLWSALIAFIPLILGTIGVAVILISVYSLFVSIPSWVWGLLIVGGSILILGPTISKAVEKYIIQPATGGYEKYKVMRA